MQAHLVEVDRITMIYDDDSTRLVHGGYVRSKPDGTKQILIGAPFVPREHLGMELVAAHADGSVEASLTVADMWSEDGKRVYSPTDR